MSEVAWASDALQGRLSPIGSARNVETRIRNAARKLGWSFSRTRDVWYADPRVSVKPRELRDIEEITGVRYGRQEVQQLDDLIAGADALLLGRDPHRLRALAHALLALAGAADSARAPAESDADFDQTRWGR